MAGPKPLQEPCYRNGVSYLAWRALSTKYNINETYV